MVSELSQRQTQILEMYVVLGLSTQEIASRLQITKRAVYKHLKKLQKKGFLEYRKIRGSQKHIPVSSQPMWKRYFRLHNLHLKIEPYRFYPRYRENISKFGIPYNIWTIMINTLSVELIMLSQESFDSPDLNECKRLAQQNIQKVIFHIENRFGFEAWKNQKCNITLVNHHIAEVENGIAKDVEGTFMQVTGSDHKIWCQIDLSIKKPELEFVHPRRAFDDAELISKYLNDWRDNNPPTSSEIAVLSQQNALLIRTLYREYPKPSLTKKIKKLEKQSTLERYI